MKLPDILEHTTLGPADVLVLHVDDDIWTNEQIGMIREAIPDALSGRVLVVAGEASIQVVRK